MRPRVPPPTGLTVAAGAVTLAVVSATGGYLVGKFAHLAPYLPVHFTRQGLADRWHPKSWALVLMPLWVQLALAVVFGALVLLLLWRSAPGGSDVDGDRVDAEWRRMRLAAEGIALLACVWIGFQGLGALRLVALWERGYGGLGRVYGVGLLVAIVVSIAIGVFNVARLGREPGMPLADSRYWRLKVLYVNPADPALFVPARWGVGWTLNFGRPAAVVLLAIVLLVGLAAPILIVRVLTR
jgi:uncharacterized membrane protein